MLRANQLIKTGEVIEMAHVLNDKMPFFGTRRFDVHVKRSFMNEFSNRRGSNEEVVISEIGQVGTQFDGFAHQTPRGWPLQLLQDRRHLDAGQLHQARHREGRHPDDPRRADRRRGLKGVDMLPDTYEITVQDLQDALAEAARDAAAGRRGLHRHRLEQAMGEGQRALREVLPGHRRGRGEWLARRDPMLIGSDNWPVEVAPNPDPRLSLPVHQVTLVVNGIHLLENLKLDDLAAKQVYEFAFVMQPLKTQGFTGSTVAPVAIR